MLALQSRDACGFYPESVACLFQARFPCGTDLVASMFKAKERSDVCFASRQVLDQFVGLVESALTQARGRQGDGDHAICGFKRWFDPRRVAHQLRKGTGEADIALKLKLCDACRPWVTVGHGGKASV